MSTSTAIADAIDNLATAGVAVAAAGTACSQCGAFDIPVFAADERHPALCVYCAFAFDDDDADDVFTCGDCGLDIVWSELDTRYHHLDDPAQPGFLPDLGCFQIEGEDKFSPAQLAIALHVAVHEQFMVQA